eukprot:TRINITY_DN21097_c0_g1_i1.p2 TRINITY_DN21097_c0_g1~~TRINITY_DN21097_c0_g1_i1.p2  ORF type:complete len:263 (+),score=127.99 TRINITY_DN21097_c0_g1_i1:104-790(+)
MMRRAVAPASRVLAGQVRRAAAASWQERKAAPAPPNGIFGSGWDRASLDVVFRSIVKRPHIREVLKHHYAWATDDRTLERAKAFGDNCDIVQVQLAPDIGDPHRVLKQYSIMDAPVIDIDGKHVAMMGGHVYYDDDGTKIAIVDQTPVEALAKEILWTVGASKSDEPEPKDARKFLEELYGDVQVPEDLHEIKDVLTEDSLLYPEDVWPEAWKGGARYGKYQRGLGSH